MNVEKKHAAWGELRQHVAAEVIEPGEMLFDMAIDAASPVGITDTILHRVNIETYHTSC